jgi:hypothetical protein
MPVIGFLGDQRRYVRIPLRLRPLGVACLRAIKNLGPIRGTRLAADPYNAGATGTYRTLSS